MAWRHRSSNEKTLLKVIAFLVFALTCFIITVTVMDITYKAKIKDLEDQLDQQQSSTTEALTSHTSTLASTLTSLSSTTPPPTTTTAAPTTTTTTTLAPTTTPAPSTTPTTAAPPTTPPATTESETSQATTSSLLLEALQSLLRNFSGISSASDSVDSARMSKGLFSRTRGTFVIVADVRHEQSRPAPTPPAPDAANATEPFESPLVYIDEAAPSAAPPPPPQGRGQGETTETKEDDLYDADDDDDYAGPRRTTTSDFKNDLEALSTKEGSGVDDDKMTVPP